MNRFNFNKENTFCISLKETNSQRWKKMCERFDFFNMDVSRYEAVYKEEDIIDNFPEWLSLPQKGCSQSHINLYRNILRNDNINYALILEDDAMFDINWKEKLEIFDIEMGEWDAIFLNASEPIIPRNCWVGCISEQYLTAGYIISRRGVERILKLGEEGGIFFASDWMTTRLQVMGECYSYFPWLIIQEGYDTSIGNHLEDDHLKVVNCLEDVGYTIYDNYV